MILQRLSDFEQQYQIIQSSLQTTPCKAPFLTSQHATSQPQLQSSQHLSSEKNSLVIQQSCFSNDIEGKIIECRVKGLMS